MLNSLAGKIVLNSLAEMYDISSSLFWYKMLFLVELCVAGSLIGGKLKRRPNFVLRFVLAIAALFVITFALPILSYSSFYTSILFFVIFVLFLGATKIFRDESWGSIIFCGCWAYTVQHLSYQIYTLIITAMGINVGNIYTGDLASGEYSGLSIAIFFEVYIGVYVVVWGITRLRLAKIESLNLRKWRLLVLSGAMLFIEKSFLS